MACLLNLLSLTPFILRPSWVSLIQIFLPLLHSPLLAPTKERSTLATGHPGGSLALGRKSYPSRAHSHSRNHGNCAGRTAPTLPWLCRSPTWCPKEAAIPESCPLRSAYVTMETLLCRDVVCKLLGTVAFSRDSSGPSCIKGWGDHQFILSLSLTWQTFNSQLTSVARI